MSVYNCNIFNIEVVGDAKSSCIHFYTFDIVHNRVDLNKFNLKTEWLLLKLDWRMKMYKHKMIYAMLHFEKLLKTGNLRKTVKTVKEMKSRRCAESLLSRNYLQNGVWKKADNTVNQ